MSLPNDPQVRVEVTVRVVPLDTAKPVGTHTAFLLYENPMDVRTQCDVVARTAALAYRKAAGVSLPTPPQEGGR